MEQAERPEVELLISEGMWQGFNWEPDLPEAVIVRAAVRDFVTNEIALLGAA